jgi:hypothetical protein
LRVPGERVPEEVQKLEDETLLLGWQCVGAKFEQAFLKEAD